ncbi:hypothetical protein [Cetobacterium sp.]|uniref:hypothetical protein n=1 Tax=Cetobacterium sp. TaxID=2071632 RepID=UPI002FCA23D1
MAITTYKIIYSNGYVVECRSQEQLKTVLRISMRTVYNMFQRGHGTFKDLDIVELQKCYNNVCIEKVRNSEREKLEIENENEINF